MVEIYFVRHGYSNANIDNLFAGHWDVDLTQIGREQADVTAKFFNDKNIDAIYSSDLKRAIQTAQPIAKEKNLNIILSKGMREIDGGKWEGKSFSYLTDNYPEEYLTWRKNIGEAKCPGGESISELYERVCTTVNNIIKENENKTICVVTHATPIRVLQSYFLQKPLSTLHEIPWVTNNSITQVQFDGNKFQILLNGDTKHLGELKTTVPSNI